MERSDFYTCTVRPDPTRTGDPIRLLYLPILYTLITSVNEVKSTIHTFSNKDQLSEYDIDTTVNAGILSKTWLGLFQIR